MKVSYNWLKNYLDATKKNDVDLIIELIGGAEGAAKKLVFSALKNKKRSNKPEGLLGRYYYYYYHYY